MTREATNAKTAARGSNRIERGANRVRVYLGGIQPESQKIAGLIAFYDERVDTRLNGVKQDRPKTHFA